MALGVGLGVLLTAGGWALGRVAVGGRPPRDVAALAEPKPVELPAAPAAPDPVAGLPQDEARPVQDEAQPAQDDPPIAGPRQAEPPATSKAAGDVSPAVTRVRQPPSRPTSEADESPFETGAEQVPEVRTAEAFVSGLPAVVDISRRKPATGAGAGGRGTEVSLGRCDRAVWTMLEICMAGPRLGRGARPMLLAAPVEESQPADRRWRILRQQPAGDGEGKPPAPTGIAELLLRDGELVLRILPDDGTIVPLLLRGLVGIRVKDGDAPYRYLPLVKPVALQPAREPPSLAPAIVAVPLPSYLTDAGVPLADWRIDVEVGGRRVTLAPQATEVGTLTAAHRCFVLADGAVVGLRLEFVPAAAELRIEPTVADAGGNDPRLAELVRLLTAGDEAAAEFRERLEKQFRSVAAMTLRAAVMPTHGTRIDRFFGETLMAIKRVPVVAGTMGSALGAHLQRRDSDDWRQPTSFEAWRQQSVNVIERARDAYGGRGYGWDAQRPEEEWKRVFTDTLAAWWTWQMPEFSRAFDELLRQTRQAAAQKADVTVASVSLAAYAPDGTERPVPLVIAAGPDARRPAGPARGQPAGDDAPATRPPAPTAEPSLELD